jgi:hypothetical protein
MQPLTLANLAANPYRTLGIGGSADQAAIELAARRLRIWADPRHIPATPWDLPGLGPIDRSRAAVEQAVARLDNPESRVQERLTWYTGPVPPVNMPDGGKASEGFPGMHDRAIAALHAAWAADPEALDAPLWEDVWGRLSRLADSMDFLDWMLHIENEGGFEKRASLEEIGQATIQLVPALAQGLRPKARSAVDRGDKAAGAALMALLRREQAGEGSAAGRLIDDLEDEVVGRCRKAAAQLHKTLANDPAAPENHRVQNIYNSFMVAEEYRDEIAPRLKQLLDLLGPGENDRRERVQTHCAELLMLTAIGWEWAGDPLKAKESLLTALEVGEALPLKASIEQELARIRPEVEQARWRKRYRSRT